MSFAMLVLVIAITNLSLGFVVGAVLWGTLPTGFLRRRRAVVTEEPVETPRSGFVSDLDLRRLVDQANQRDRKLRQCKSSATEPFQQAWGQWQLAAERAETVLDVIEARLMASNLVAPAVGWEEFMSSLQGEGVGAFEAVEETLERVFESLPGREQHRLSSCRKRLQDSIDLTVATIEAWEVPVQAEAGAAACYLGELRNLIGPFRSAWQQLNYSLLDTLSENYPVDEWELDLLRHPRNRMQTMIALDAERHEQDVAGQAMVAMLGPDTSPEWLAQYGGLLVRLAGDRLGETYGSTLPAHWLVATLGNGRFVVRGDAASRDEFLAELERLRQRIAATTLKVGDTSLSITFTTGVRQDDSSIPTSHLIEELWQRVRNASTTGAGRLVICDGEVDVPVAPVTCQIEPNTLDF